MLFSKKTNPLRISLLTGLSLLVGVLMGIYSPINLFYLDMPIIGVIEIMISLFSFYCFWCAKTGKAKVYQSYVLVFLTTFLIYLAAYSADIRALSFLWGLALPIVYYLMFGEKQGFYFTCLILLPSIYILFINSPSEEFISYRAIVNYTFAHFFIWFLCHLYEKQHNQDKIQLQIMAHNDALTGVKNRHALEKHFKRLEKNAIQANVLLVDIDFFKLVNDEFGHSVGDAVLIEVAKCLQSQTDEDAIYRLGGEEFVILLEKVSIEDSRKKAEQIRHAIEQHTFHSHDLHLHLTVSIGVAQSSLGNAMIDALHRADNKLYQAKNKGRNAVCA